MSLALVCSGQGAQAPGLFESFPFTEKGHELRLRLQSLGILEPDVVQWLDHPSERPELIYQNRFSQPLICLFQLMVWEELRERVPDPRLYAGYSLGELSAYGCVGAVPPEEVLRLATARARFMDQADSGDMVAVTGLPVESVQAVVTAAGAFLAIVLAPDHCVVGTGTGGGEPLVAALNAAGAAGVTRLPVSVPSHTPLLDAAVAPFRETLSKSPWISPRAPVLAGVDGSRVLNRDQMLRLLPEQIHRTVRWDRVRQAIVEAGATVILELGPGCQLAHTFLGSREPVAARSVAEFRTLDGIRDWIQRSLDQEA